MNHQNRVLIRRGARELTRQETDQVMAGSGLCPYATPPPSPDGDPLQRGWLPRSFGCAPAPPKSSFLKSLGPLNGPKMMKGEKHE